MILFIVLVSCVAAEFDNFYFHTSIACSLSNKPSYFYDIKFTEDHLMPENAVQVSGWTRGNITRRGITNETYFGQEDRDQYYGYQFYATIQHDCLLRGDPQIVEVMFIKNYCQLGKGDCHIYAYIDLTGLITRGESMEYREVIVKQG